MDRTSAKIANKSGRTRIVTAPQNRASLEALSQGFSTSLKTKCRTTPPTTGHKVHTPPQGFRAPLMDVAADRAGRAGQR